jgi:hypothetical protein
MKKLNVECEGEEPGPTAATGKLPEIVINTNNVILLARLTAKGGNKVGIPPYFTIILLHLYNF